MKFVCYAKVVGTKFLGTIEANDEKEALKLAGELDSAGGVRVCHQCSDEIEDPQIDEIFVEAE